MSEVAIPDADQLAPAGEFGVNYVAPFPVTITLDGDFSDWAGVPTMTIPQNYTPGNNDPALTFAVAADATHLYFFADIIDDNIISGEHGESYWNEDSAEFYINATGDLSLSSYQDGVAQITIPALNFANPEQAIISGMNGNAVGVELEVIQTETGWAVEASIPLENNVWSIVPAQDTVLGFQVHLNGASTNNRDTKLIWSLADTGDTSYQNPSVFGELTFYEVSGE